MAKKVIDITKSGPLGFRQLQELNDLSQLDLSPEFILAMQSLDNISKSATLYNPYTQGDQYFQSDLFNPNRVTGPDYYGASRYDEPVVTDYQAEHLLDIRANNQGTISKLGAGIGKAATTAATTYLDGTLGIIYGIGSAINSAITEDKPWQQDLAKIFDNDVSNALQKVNQAMEEILPNYRTELEEQNAWYLNMGTANFWADFIKQIGFTVGAYYSGGAWLKGLKAVGLLSQAGSAGLVGSLLGAVNEGRIEANNNSNDWYNLEKAKLDDAYTPLILDIIDSLDRMIPDPSDPEGYNYVSEKQLRLLELKNNYDAALQDLELRKAKMGLVDLAINVPLLTATNMFQFGKMYKRGFDSSKTLTGSQNYLSRMKLGFKEALKGEEKVAIENVAKNAETKLYDFIPTKIGKAALRGAEHFLSEGSEEMNQMWASELAGTAYQYDSPDSYYKALTDPKAIQETRGFLEGITEGFSNSWGNLNNYQDFIMGGLTGLLGTPTFGRVLNSTHETYLGRGKMIGLTGGIGGEISRANYENQIGLAATDEMNAYLKKYGKPFTDRARHHVASNYFTDLMNGASAEGDAFEYHNMSDNEEFNAIDAFAQTGNLDDYKELVRQDFENMSDEDLEFISNSTINTQTGKPLYTQSDGTTPITRDSSEEDKLAMRESLIKKRDSMLKSIDQYEKSLASMRSISGITDNDDAVRELAWLDWKIKRFSNRTQELVSENRDNIRTIINALQLNNSVLQEQLDNFTKNEESTLKNKEYIDSYSALQKENNSFIKILEGWLSNKYMPLSDYGKLILLSDDFYKDWVEGTDLNYTDYSNLALSVIDVDRLATIKLQFDDRLKYYLDNSEPVKKPRGQKKAKKEPATTTTLLEQSSTPTELPNESIPNLPAIQSFSTRLALQVELAELTSPALTPLNQPTLAELKILNEHTTRDAQLAELNAVNQSNELRTKIESVTTPSQLQSILEDEDTDLVSARAILKDIEATNPNHPVVRANALNKFVDKVYDAMHTDALGDSNADVYYMIKDLADQVSSVEELKLAALDENNLAEIVGYRTPEPLNPKYVEDMTKFKQALSDILNKITEDTNTASTLASDTTPQTYDTQSTGADDTSTNNIEVTSQTKTPSEDVTQFVSRVKSINMGDSQIIDTGIKLGYSKQELQNAINAFNGATQVTEDSAAIKPNYTDELVNTEYSTTSEADVTAQLSEELPQTDVKGFLRVSTTEYPSVRDIELNKKKYSDPKNFNNDPNLVWIVDGKFQYDRFNYDKWLELHNYPENLKLSLRVRHRYLSENGAFARADKGEIKESQVVRFKVIKAANEESLDFIVFMTDELGNLIGDLPTNVDNYPGLLELINDIQAKYQEGGEPDNYIYPIESHISLVLLGKPQFTNTILPIQEINPNLHLGIYTGLRIQSSTSGNSNPVVAKNEILLPLNPKRGLVYVLVPNGKLGSLNGYTPVLCTVPRLGAEISDTIIRDKIVEHLTTLSLAKDFSTLLKAFTALLDYLWIPDIQINAFNGLKVLTSGSKEPITLIVIKRRVDINNPNSELQTLIKINPNDPNSLRDLANVLLGTPLHINLKFLNTPEGREMYNQVVRTNLPIGTESTVNNWFTVNPIVDDKEVAAPKIKSTGINPNEHKSTNEVFDIDGHKLELDSKNYKVWVDGKEQTPLPITDPRHITTRTNTYLAQAFANNNPTAHKIGDAVQTPYGWYDTKLRKLVSEPKAEEASLQPLVAFKGETPKIIGDVEYTSETKEGVTTYKIKGMPTDQKSRTGKVRYMSYSIPKDAIIIDDRDEALNDATTILVKEIREGQPVGNAPSGIVADVVVKREDGTSFEGTYFLNNNPLSFQSPSGQQNISSNLVRERSYFSKPVIQLGDKQRSATDAELQLVRHDIIEAIERETDFEYKGTMTTGDGQSSWGATGESAHDVFLNDAVKKYLGNTGYTYSAAPSLWSIVNYIVGNRNLYGQTKTALFDKYPQLEAIIAQIILDRIPSAHLTSQESRPVSQQTSSNPDSLGQTMINGKMDDVLKSELENAILYGFADDSIFDESLEELAKVIEEYRGSYRIADTIQSEPKKFDKEKELKWLERVLPQLTFNERELLIKGLIDNRAWGKFMNGIIFLSDRAAEGTTYHEAFHAVSQTLLTDRERDRMYKAAREVYGKKSIYDLEEALAEDFRKKIQTNTQPDSRLRRFFNRLSLLIKSIFDNRAKLDKLFYDINQGIYADRVQKIRDGQAYRQATINQVKSDDGNIGTFSTTDNNIYYRDIYTKENVLESADSRVNRAVTSKGFLYRESLNRLWGLFVDSYDREGYIVKGYYDTTKKKYIVASVSPKPSYQISELSEEDNLALLEDTNSMILQFNLEYDTLDSETIRLLELRGITEEIWNEMSIEERYNAKECAGVY